MHCSRSRSALLFAVLACCLAGMMSACGRKGPLFLPEEKLREKVQQHQPTPDTTKPPASTEKSAQPETTPSQNATP